MSAAVEGSNPRPDRTWMVPMVAWPRRHVPLLLVLLVLVLTGAGAAWSIQPPAPVAADTPADRFSAYRAAEHLDAIASEPHPTGSAAGTEVRDYLVGQLRQLGLTVDADSSVVARPEQDDAHLVGTVSNVHAVMPGRDSTGRVLLVAHYDSVPTGPGAADNASNVAAVLEIVRALRATGQPRNDVEVLFTDAEEAGLLGAIGFVERQSAADRRRTVVLNLEARGTRGSVIMFQTVGGSSRLTGPLGASRAVSTSMSDEVYRALPNDTDLTVFGEAGFAGLNFAYVAGSAHYHTAHDDLNHLDLASVQEMGDVVLPATRQLADTDLPNELTSSGEGTYFSVFGWLVHYPEWVVLPFALLAAAGFAALLWRARRSGVRPGKVGLVALAFPLPLIGSVLIGVGVWLLLSLLRPEYQLFRAGDPYRPGWYVAGQVCLAVVALLLWHRWMRRWCSAEESGTAVLGWLAALGLLTAWLLPGGAYLFTWPALFGCAGAAAALRFSPPGSQWRQLGGTAAATFAGALLLLPVALLLFPALGLATAAAPLLFLTVLWAAALGFADLVRPRMLTAGMLVVAMAAPLLLGGGLLLDRPDHRHPTPDSLAYAVDADTGEALWLAAEEESDPAVTRRLSARPAPVEELFPNLDARWRTGAAGRAVRLPAPELEPLDEEQGETRTVRFRLRAGADTYRIGLYADTSRHRIVGASVAGADLPGGVNRPEAGGGWRWAAEYVGPLADGVVVELRVRGAGDLPVRVVAMSVGLPARAAPPGRSPSSPVGYPSVAGQVMVARGFTV